MELCIFYVFSNSLSIEAVIIIPMKYKINNIAIDIYDP